MVTKNMAYDHPAYTVPYVYSGSTTVGANGVTTKFAAFTAMKIKQVVSAPNLALVSTSATQPLLYSQSGTTTATATLSAVTSAAYTALTDDISEVTLAAGDVFWYTHGTDATTSRSVSIECVAIPGAAVAA